MNEKLSSIFVPVEVAEMAKEKGFNEWCACVYNHNGFIPNSDNDWDFSWGIERSKKAGCINIPTHYQLIKWLNESHHIDVPMHYNGLWDVQNKEGDYEDLGLELNEALMIALSLIEVKP